MIVSPSNLLTNIKSFNLKDSLGVKKLIVWVATQSFAPWVHTCSPESHHHAGNHACQVPHTVSVLSPSDPAELTTFMMFFLVLSWWLTSVPYNVREVFLWSSWDKCSLMEIPLGRRGWPCPLEHLQPEVEAKSEVRKGEWKARPANLSLFPWKSDGCVPKGRAASVRSLGEHRVCKAQEVKPLDFMLCPESLDLVYLRVGLPQLWALHNTTHSRGAWPLPICPKA